MTRELDVARLHTSLAKLRVDLRKLDDEIAQTASELVRRRRYLVEVIWTVKDALDEPHIDAQREQETDELRWADGMDPEIVEILKTFREASRPLEGEV